MRRILVIGAVLVVAACAQNAPDLPPDTTGINAVSRMTPASFSPADQALTCQQINAEFDANRAAMQQDDQAITGSRGHDEAVASAAFLLAGPAAMGLQSHAEARQDYKVRLARNDTLRQLGIIQGCTHS
jgi:hypothetical protein